MELTLEQLKQAIAKAIAEGNDSEFNKLMKDYNSRKSDIAKAEAAAALKEAEALAGTREKLQAHIMSLVKPLKLDKELAAVKSKGFVFTIDHKEDEKGRLDINGTVTVKGGVGLLIPAIRVRASGGNGGGAGKTKDEFGMSLDEVYQKFANADEKKRFAEAEVADIKHQKEHSLASPKQSNRWRVKSDVKKRVLKEGLLAPQK